MSPRRRPAYRPTSSSVSRRAIRGAAAGAGGVGAGGLLDPESVATLDGGGGRTAIVVADGTGNRVVEWDDVPNLDGASFDRVYGQADRTTTTANTGGLSMGSLDQPQSVTADDENRFWVGDFGNGRALRFDLDSPSAIGIFGQRSGTSTEIYPGSFSTTHSGWAHFWKGELSMDPTSGLFTTSFLQRAMFWDSPPRDGHTAATSIQGQVDATTCVQQPPTSPTSLAGHGSAVRVGDRTYWSDTNRITFDARDVHRKQRGARRRPRKPGLSRATRSLHPRSIYAIAPSFLATDGQKLLAVDGARVVGLEPGTAGVARACRLRARPAEPARRHGEQRRRDRELPRRRPQRAHRLRGEARRRRPCEQPRPRMEDAIPTTSGVAADVVLEAARLRLEARPVPLPRR